MKKSVLFIAVLFVFTTVVYSQNSPMFVPLNIKKTYESKTRSMDGKPGENYWQNRSEYKISAELDPVNFKLSGTAEIVYHNESPNKLFFLVMRLYPDIFRKGVQRDFDINPNDLTDGVNITKLLVNGKPVELTPGKPKAVRRNGTNMNVPLPEPMESKTQIKIEIEWNYAIPQRTRSRMGVYGPNTFFIAYWYPQIAVYDDSYGWDNIPFKGTVEFYNDFNDYDVNITVPEKYGVWATGVLQNGKDNYTSAIWKKVEDAKKSEKVINIITKEDVEKGGYTKTGSKLTYHYVAENVTDFAFAAGDSMSWDASTVKLPNGKEAFVSSIYNKNMKNCEEIADYARKSVDYFSKEIPGIPYPYPSMTVFNHPGGGGMEYPMMTNDGIGTNKESNAGVTAHEIAHTYMPFYMGINEKRYAYMDEGWAVMFTNGALKHILPETDSRNGNGMNLSFALGQEEELPMVINSDILAGGSGMSYGVASYQRAGVAYDLLRNVLGEELFKKALKEYVDRWHGKHPRPQDFFYTFNSVAGENLEWFWVPWFYERGYADLSIKNVSVYEGTYKTEISKDGILPVPINLKYTFEDGTSEEVTRPITVWRGGNKEYSVEYKPSKKVTKIELGAGYIPDADKSNNKYFFKSESLTTQLNKLKDYTGTYEVTAGMTFSIMVEGDQLVAEPRGDRKYTLEPIKDKPEEYSIVNAPVTVKFLRDENKKINAMEINEQGRITKAAKVK